MRQISLTIIFLFSLSFCYSQTTGRNNKFSITGEIVGRDTGSVILWYFDSNNKGIADTFQLYKGKFHFSGTVNRVCEALLWTDPKNHIFDNPGMLRFLLEPGNINMVCKKDNESNGIIKGSASQIEKEKWDNQKASLLSARAEVYKSIFSLVKLSKADKNPELQIQLKRLAVQRDSILERIKEIDLGYLKRHTNSYLSAYLLSQHQRKLSVDSIKAYYNALAGYIKTSGVGHTVLQYIYPLTNDNDFRKANPLVDKIFDQRLSSIKSLYDLSLKDSSGNTIGLSSFKGKYLVIDFWASWCKPCIENIPALNQMIESYNPDSIQFISISLDRDVNDWKRSMLKHNYKGIQLSDLNEFNSLTAIYCKVLWVPTYIIADRNGRIINYDAPHAMDSGLKILIDNLLKER